MKFKSHVSRNSNTQVIIDIIKQLTWYPEKKKFQAPELSIKGWRIGGYKKEGNTYLVARKGKKSVHINKEFKQIRQILNGEI